MMTGLEMAACVSSAVLATVVFLIFMTKQEGGLNARVINEKDIVDLSLYKNDKGLIIAEQWYGLYSSEIGGWHSAANLLDCSINTYYDEDTPKGFDSFRVIHKGCSHAVPILLPSFCSDINKSQIKAGLLVILDAKKLIMAAIQAEKDKFNK